MAALTAIDLFSGAGGLTLGLKMAGFEIVGAIDNDTAAVRTYRENIGNHIHGLSLGSVEPKQVAKSLGIQRGSITLVAGGPPCQGFSLQRRGSRTDARNRLVLEFLGVVRDLQPTFFLMENVEGFLSRHGRPFLTQLCRDADAAGYRTSVGILDAVRFGVPQYRKRAFLVGSLRGDVERPFRFPAGESQEVKWKTVRDAIGDLPSPPADGSEHPDFRNHFREAKLSSLNKERLRYIPPGGGRLDLPEHLQLRCHRDNPSHRHLDVYGRLAWDRPAGTITARFDSFTRGRFAHPEEHRSITLREGARLQTFPDDFVFHGSREEVARQIGNAVPPLVARAIGQALFATLTGFGYDVMEEESDSQLFLSV